MSNDCCCFKVNIKLTEYCLAVSPQSLAKTQAELETAEFDLQAVQKTASEYQTKRDTLETQLDQINNTLRQAKDDRRKDKEEERILNAIGALKRHFPGVKGRLVDLCRPSQNRYNMAVTVAGGKDMDAVVVDTKQTAFDCIKYLRGECSINRNVSYRLYFPTTSHCSFVSTTS